MKAIVLTAVAMTLAASLCFAQSPAAPMKHEAKPAVAAVKTLTGTVDAVNLADAVKGTKPEITIVDAGGTKAVIAVAPTAVIHDAQTQLITLDKLAKGEKVEVTTSAAGAVLIKVVK